MANRIAFQTQLASIMEVLANAAVAEICKLVDDDYAVINLQMTQCQRENKAMKRKLHILELKMARGSAERRISALNRGNRVQVSAALSYKFRNQTNVSYEAPFNTGLWRGGGTDSTGQQKTVTNNNRTVEDPVVSEVNTVLIKEEMFEENQLQPRLFIRDGLPQTSQARVADFGDHMVTDESDQVSGVQQHILEQQKEDGDGEPATLVLKKDLNNQWEESQKQEPIMMVHDESDTDICSRTLSTSPTKNTVTLGAEKLVDLDFSHLQENGFDRCQKTDISPSIEVEIQDVMESSSSKQYRYHTSAVGPSKPLTGEKPSYMNSGHKGAVNSSTLPTNQPILSREKIGTNCLYERPAEHKDRFTRWNSETASSSSCCYTKDSNQDQDCVLVQSEPVLSVRGSKGRLKGPLSSRTHCVRNADAPEGPIREKETWNQGYILKHSQSELSGHISRPEGVQVETAGTTNPSYFNNTSTQIMPSFSQPGVSLAGMNLPPHIEKDKRKGYICKFCGKAFAGMSNVVAHQRVHTGEKPFKCDICGKLFTEAGNLKKHQRVHTGEKPYICNRCGRRFAWICNLKTHQQSAACGGVS
ncbi:zinc finger protein 827 isoform X3 [Triplophysa rosa]|uniref:zinc finger protein 827 isoform X3 n=1 Tax=Triplophysa rosa TaxID=992332 RepID=UPI002545F3F2|nr:zinc finger protein 827 isoform X3 [Triplophysa rosa]